MKLRRLRIRNLRCFADETVAFDDYTCFVGANGAGKSTILHALNVLFREEELAPTSVVTLTEEDFHRRNVAEPVEITATFGDLSLESQKDFANYYRQNELTISAVATFNEATKSAPVNQMGNRKVMPAFARYFKASEDARPVAELKEIYQEITKSVNELHQPPGKLTKAAMTTALRDYEEAHTELCELIPSRDEFYGFSKGKNLLNKYIQWVYVPAVKDVLPEQQESRTSALGKLLARTVRTKVDFAANLSELRMDLQQKYSALVQGNDAVLHSLSEALTGRLQQWAHPDASMTLQWALAPEKAVTIEEPTAHVIAGEAGFSGDLARFGHGLQRSFFLALLQELAGADDNTAPTLLLGCEEPEIYQHPPQARHLASVFQRLSRGNSQVFVTSHSPYFVSGEAYDHVRVVRKRGGPSTVRHASTQAVCSALAKAAGVLSVDAASGVMAKIHQELLPGLAEMFFTSVLVLVEGMEDLAYVNTHLLLSGRSTELRRLGCSVVTCGGKSHMIRPRAIASCLEIPTFTVFDSDAHERDKNGSRAKHEGDNAQLLRLCRVQSPDPLPKQTLWGANVVMWASEIGEIVEQEIGGAEWDRIKERVRARYGYIDKLDKNFLFVADCIQDAWKDGRRSSSLERLCEAIVAFARSPS